MDSAIAMSNELAGLDGSLSKDTKQQTSPSKSVTAKSGTAARGASLNGDAKKAAKPPPPADCCIFHRGRFLTVPRGKQLAEQLCFDSWARIAF